MPKITISLKLEERLLKAIDRAVHLRATNRTNWITDAIVRKLMDDGHWPRAKHEGKHDGKHDQES